MTVNSKQMGFPFVFFFLYYSLQFHSRCTLIKGKIEIQSTNIFLSILMKCFQLCVNNDQMLCKVLVKDSVVIYCITLINIKQTITSFPMVAVTAAHQSQSQSQQRVCFQSISLTPNACQMC